VHSAHHPCGYKISFQSFSWACLYFSKKTDLLFVCDVPLLLARDGVRLCNGKKYFYNRRRNFKPIPNGRNLSSWFIDDSNTKISVSEPYGTARGSAFKRKIFCIRSCWKFYNKCSLYRIVYPEIFEYFSHAVRKRIANCSLTN